MSEEKTENSIIPQHKDFSTSASISSYCSDLESLLYDLKDSDYEGNIDEINSLEAEIKMFERVMDPSLESPQEKEKVESLLNDNFSENKEASSGLLRQK